MCLSKLPSSAAMRLHLRRTVELVKCRFITGQHPVCDWKCTSHWWVRGNGMRWLSNARSYGSLQNNDASVLNFWLLTVSCNLLCDRKFMALLKPLYEQSMARVLIRRKPTNFLTNLPNLIVTFHSKQSLTGCVCVADGGSCVPPAVRVLPVGAAAAPALHPAARTDPHLGLPLRHQPHRETGEFL